MPTIRTIHETDRVKVAVVFELGKVRPVWFEIAGKPRIQVSDLCAIWYHASGAARIMNFDVGGGGERYCLTFDTLALAWSVGRTVIE